MNCMHYDHNKKFGPLKFRKRAIVNNNYRTDCFEVYSFSFVFKLSITINKVNHNYFIRLVQL